MSHSKVWLAYQAAKARNDVKVLPKKVTPATPESDWWKGSFTGLRIDHSSFNGCWKEYEQHCEMILRGETPPEYSFVVERRERAIRQAARD